MPATQTHAPRGGPAQAGPSSAASRAADEDELKPYVLAGELGKGSFAIVYKGYQEVSACSPWAWLRGMAQVHLRVGVFRCFFVLSMAHGMGAVSCIHDKIISPICVQMASAFSQHVYV